MKELFLKQRLRELFGVEGLQVVRLFAEADELDGHAEFLLDRHDHAAFARAVELGHDETGERDGTSKGGMVVAIQKELGLPIKFIGLGEQPDDLQPFDAKQFAAALFEE